MSEIKKIATRDSYGNTLVELGKEHDNLVVLDADLAGATKTGVFKKEFPERHIDCGIAEGNMAGIAAGLATCGKVPFMSSFAMFAAGRAFEQVRNSIGYPHLNVKIGATHAGISVGEDGATHQCNEDIALMRTIPGMVVINPCDDVEAKAAVRAAYEYEGPVYLRFGRLAVPVINDEATYKFEIGKGIVLKEGKDVTIIATGLCVNEALEAAKLLAAQIVMKPDCVLGLATGSSPIGTYEQLIEWYKNGDLDFSQVKSVNLDEYKGLDHENDQSYYYFMHENLFDHVNIDPANTNVPDGMAEDTDAECQKYEELIDALGGIDMQLLGLGRNGHIGFNEPDASFAKMTHCVQLTESTIEANKRFFASADDVPKQALSMGIGSIMKSDKILVVVSGEDKAEALAKAVCGEITPEVPASILQLHKNVTIVADEAALSKMPEKINR